MKNYDHGFVFICEGVCAFLDHPRVQVEDVPGRKGSAKMKQLFRDCGRGYHKGSRARQMIDSLDMQKIIDQSALELYRLEEVIFST